jgi:sigma-B regulation protein RsbQ
VSRPDVAGAVLRRHATTVLGGGSPPLVLGHGFGCDQTMWSRVAPELAREHQVVLFDHIGAGRSDRAAYDPVRHASLRGYAEDVVELLDALALPPVVLVGHSASGMIGLLAAVARPDLFAGLVLVGASPRYLDAEGYVGGFSRADVDDLLAAMERNYLGWSESLAPLAMGNPDRPELAAELQDSFARSDPAIALAFARAIFLSDHRGDLALVRTPTLVVQSSEDPMVPEAVGEYLHAHVPGSRYVRLAATGHFPHVSSPGATVEAVRAFVSTLG